MSLPSPVRLLTDRLVLTMPGREDAARVVDYFARNAAHLAPWEPPHPAGFLTTAYWAERLDEQRREHLEDRSLRLAMFLRGDPTGEMVGVVSFTAFIRASFQACNLGYSVDARHEGRGLMTEALRAAIAHVTDELRMHRIQASYRPDNVRSARLLERLGFVIEGYARDYLFIDGAWRDHVLTSYTSHAPPVVEAP